MRASFQQRNHKLAKLDMPHGYSYSPIASNNGLRDESRFFFQSSSGPQQEHKLRLGGIAFPGVWCRGLAREY